MLQAKYDPREDRMLVTLRQPDAEPAAFWVTRRQWLAALHDLDRMPQAQAAVAPEAPAAPEERRRRAQLPPAEPQALRALRLQPTQRGARLVFVAEAGNATFGVPEPLLPRLRHMFLTQCEQAGWDGGAAMERLAALDMAGEVVRRARGSS